MRNIWSRLTDLLTLGVLAFACALFVDAKMSKPSRAAASLRAQAAQDTNPYQNRADLRGVKLDTKPLRESRASGSLRNRDSTLKMLYLFTTNCSICTQQRDHMAALLNDSTLPERFAMSPEGRSARVERYWAGTPLAAQAGFTITPTVTRAIAKIETVPTLLLLDDQGKVLQALSGLLLSWTTDSVHAWVRQPPR